MQFTAIANSPVCGGEEGYTESQSTRFCNGKWNVYIQANSDEAKQIERIKIPQWSWHKIHPMVTFVMGLMYMCVHYLWIGWEKGLILKYTSGLRDRALPVMSPKTDPKHINDVRADTVNYLSRLLTDVQSFDWYCVKYMVVVLLTGAVIAVQLFYIHYLFSVTLFDFAGYKKLFENLQVPQYDRILNDEDKAVLRFPLNFYCMRDHFGTAGAKSYRQVMCDNEVNGWVEAFYIGNIYTLLALAVMWGITVVQTVSAVFCFKCFVPQTKNNYKPIRFLNRMSYGKRLLFLLISQNVDPLFFSDVVDSINDNEPTDNIPLNV